MVEVNEDPNKRPPDNDGFKCPAGYGEISMSFKVSAPGGKPMLVRFLE